MNFGGNLCKLENIGEHWWTLVNIGEHFGEHVCELVEFVGSDGH